MTDKVGIEYIGFSTSKAVISLEELAKKKKIDISKYTKGLGQDKMSVITQKEDVITLAFEAVMDAVDVSNRNNKNDNFFDDVELLLFATESAVDNSKSSACELYGLLKEKFNIKQDCRCLEVKHACYGGTGALMLAKDFVKANQNKKALVVMSDIAFYGLKTSGEPTQGCGAVAVVVSNKPNIATFCDDNVYITENKNDFYRPIFCQEPIYDGHNSIKCYLSMFQDAVKKYQEKKENKNNDRNTFDYLITHQPFTKMLDKCCKEAGIDNIENENDVIKKYNRVIGNSYTASLYIGLLSLLENSNNNLANKKIAMFSYGSGAECELFGIDVIDGYKNYLNGEIHTKKLNDRKELNYREYQKCLKDFKKRETKLNWMSKKINVKNDKKDNKNKVFPEFDNNIELTKICNGIRYYNIKID